MSVDNLRQQLRDRGYLKHGIERWFALDPWGSRTFWLELAMVALKAATLIAAFGALPLTAVMLARNYPLAAIEILGLYVCYAAVWLVVAFAFVVAVALTLKLRPALPIDTPRALLAISLAASAILTLPIAAWWSRFDARPALIELAAGLGLTAAYFLVSTIVVSAALLSFSIYELRRIPVIHQKPRGIPMTIAAAALMALLFVPALAANRSTALQPMVVTSPTSRRLALIAVDGLTYEILRSRPDLTRALPHAFAVQATPGDSTSERWASLGTGVPTADHGVRAIEGVRFRGGSQILQRISRSDFALMRIAPALGVARRQPLPPTVRRRDYVWEIFAARGVPSVAVDWWTTADENKGALHSIGPEGIFAGARGDALRLDELASTQFLAAIDRERPRFATIYLPALDVILNRIALDQSTQLAMSLRALDGITQTIALVRARGYEIVLAGMPGEGQRGSAVLASTIPISESQTAWDVAPTILDLMGFPLSTEMPGSSRAGGPAQTRISSYGPRASTAGSKSVNEEYYDNLRSLGYVR